jgi:cellulose biosynthesis protein BcsQ
MKSICFFNNKGGVGKTTLLCNVAAYVALEFRLDVLVVDADPQCNATQLILGEDEVQKLYKVPPPHKGTSTTRFNTLFDVLRPITIGESKLQKPAKFIRKSTNRFGVDLLPGHPHLALLEDRLSQAWLQLSGGDIGGARQTNWNAQLCSLMEDSFDLVFFDVGPSLGALNRSVLLGVDYFVTPMGCDVFSLLGVLNIAQWFTTWFKHYERSIESCQRAGFATELDEFGIRQDVDKMSRFIGYTVQQYITKSIDGKRRPTARYETIRKKIPSSVMSNLGHFVRDGLASDQLALPDVPHMYSLVPLAQIKKAPVHRLSYSDGLSGGTPAQKDKYTEFIKLLATAILNNADLPIQVL